MLQRLAIAGFVLAGFALGMLQGDSLSEAQDQTAAEKTRARIEALKNPQPPPEPKIVYRVVGAQEDSTMERELNELALYDCRVVGATGAGWTEANVILECPPGAPSLH